MKTQIKLAQLVESHYFLSHQYEKDLVAILKPLPNKGNQL